MKDLMQHFRPEEQSFITHLLTMIEEVRQQYAPKLTGFLDPRQVMIAQSIIGENGDVKVASEGVFQQAERKRLLLFPDYYEPTREDFDLVCYELRYPSKFIQLKHPDVLGSILAIGLERSKFGDIRVDDKKIQFIVAAEVSNYVRANLTAINKVKVNLTDVTSNEDFILSEDHWVEQFDTVSSLRLDTVLASALKISRQKLSLLIQSGHVKVNFRLTENSSFEVEEADLLSIRGFGRLSIKSIEGRTKKDKIRIIFSKLERKS
ncbi:YlmH family RNA-binding protein [Kurthia zopfii]|uniref:YlmH family RNA-binding protein n=1 Tax=Kurthia zopfii TaxID=1650 RepID=UPI000F6F25F8|nr:YlmH/Sll1252 family protein [Kurthia zopfii]VEI04782.1 photosystem II S4 domain protein [Kurthia zopfii]